MRSLVFVLAVAACTPHWKGTPHDQLFQREPVVELVKQPTSRSPSDWWDRGTQTLVRPLGRVLSPGRWLARAIGGRAAQDVNAFGQVPDSEWYENRIARRPFTANDAFLGAARSTGPATGVLRVVSGKLNGASPGFVVRDIAGVTWYLKFDPPASPELSTSAETITSRLLWLAGYHVAEVFALDIEPKRFVLDANAKTKDEHSGKRLMRQEDLDALVSPLNTDVAGRVRVLASREPDGIVLGPFDYRGIATDDPNDRIPHEHRRSLRGLWVFSAWLNNTDTRNQNSLDVWRPVSDDGRGIVRHYLLDFGNSLGATGTREKTAGEGYQYVVDWGQMLSNLFSFGLRYPPRFARSPYRSVGLFEAKLFNPEDWSPEFRNPAFDEATRDDTFWACSVLARIQPDHVRAAVTAGRYHEDGATTYVIETLLERRRKLLNYGFAGYLELDQPRVRASLLLLDDLRALAGLPSLGPIQWRVRWNHTRGSDRDLATGTLTPSTPATPTATSSGELPEATAAIITELEIDLASALAAAKQLDGFSDDPFLTVVLERHGVDVAVHLRVAGDRIIPVALER